MPATICARHVRRTCTTAAVMTYICQVTCANSAMPAAIRVQAPVAVIRAYLDSGDARVTTRVLKGVLELSVTNMTEHAHVEQATMVNNVNPSAGIVA